MERINCKFCGFGVESEHDDELMKVITEHNQEYHPDERVSERDVRQRIETMER